jgi:hypothetical protein
LYCSTHGLPCSAAGGTHEGGDQVLHSSAQVSRARESRETRNL